MEVLLNLGKKSAQMRSVTFVENDLIILLYSSNISKKQPQIRLLSIDSIAFVEWTKLTLGFKMSQSIH